MSPNQLIPIKNPELGGGFGLRRKAERLNWAHAEAFHNSLLIVETRYFLGTGKECSLLHKAKARKQRASRFSPFSAASSPAWITINLLPGSTGWKRRKALAFASPPRAKTPEEADLQGSPWCRAYSFAGRTDDVFKGLPGFPTNSF